MKKMAIFLLLSFLSLPSQTYDKSLALKGGISYSLAHLQTTTENDVLSGTGFNTHVAYKYGNWDLSLSSYIYWGNVEGLRFKAGGQTISGEGHFRHVSFGPIIKYNFNHWQFYRDFKFYIGIGPSWSLQTIKLDEPESDTATFNPNYKLTYESQGGFLMIGFEENLEHKEMHPIYIEFLYSYQRPDEVSVVDASNETEIKILSTENIKEDFQGHFFMITIGITIF